MLVNLGSNRPDAFERYVRLIEVVDSYRRIAGGRGGYWEDQGYDWYGGI